MRRSLVIYAFAPDPSEFPNIRGNFFNQCKLSLFLSLFLLIKFAGAHTPKFIFTYVSHHEKFMKIIFFLSPGGSHLFLPEDGEHDQHIPAH
jgi:hypothetical protein